MKNAQLLSLVGILLLAGSALASTPGANYRHLKHLEQMIGYWKYVGEDEQGRAVQGSETNSWIHNKNYVRVEGIWQAEGADSITYELIIGWDAALEKEVMNGMLSTGAVFRREGHYDKKQNATISVQTVTAPDGTLNSSCCTLKYGNNKDSWTATWTDGTQNGEPVTDSRIKATRVKPADTLPKKVIDELDRLVGHWSMTGEASTGQLNGIWSLKWAPGGHCLVTDYRLQVGENTSRSSEIYGWDAVTEEFVLFSNYQGGHLEICRTKLVKPGLYRGPYIVDIEGKKYEGTIEIRYQGDDEFFVTTAGLKEQGIDDLKLHGVRIKTDNGTTQEKRKATKKPARKKARVPRQKGPQEKTQPAADKTVTEEEFAEYCAAMKGRWYNADEKVADWADLGRIGKSTVSYGVISPIADGKGLSGDFFTGKGSGKWLTVWNPVAKQIQILSVLSDGTVWEEIRYEQGGKWQCEVKLNHPDGTQELIQSSLTISKDGNTHSYRGPDKADTGVYHRVAK